MSDNLSTLVAQLQTLVDGAEEVDRPGDTDLPDDLARLDDLLDRIGKLTGDHDPAAVLLLRRYAELLRPAALVLATSLEAKRFRSDAPADDLSSGDEQDNGDPARRTLAGLTALLTKLYRLLLALSARLTPHVVYFSPPGAGPPDRGGRHVITLNEILIGG